MFFSSQRKRSARPSVGVLLACLNSRWLGGRIAQVAHTHRFLLFRRVEHFEVSQSPVVQAPEFIITHHNSQCLYIFRMHTSTPKVIKRLIHGRYLQTALTETVTANARPNIFQPLLNIILFGVHAQLSFDVFVDLIQVHFVLLRLQNDAFARHLRFL